MIDITIYTGRLEAKLLAANRRITNAIEQGVSRGSDEITKEIDDFMFVPLAFTSDVEQRGEDTTAKIGVNLDLKQRQRQFVRRTNFIRSRLPRKGQQPKRVRTWPNYVRTLVTLSAKSVAMDAVVTQIRRSVR